MSLLNVCDANELTITDIQRIPDNAVDQALSAIMLKTLHFQYRTVARCIELKSEPGLWLQHVFGRTDSDIEPRRWFAWQNMKWRGVDAWALSQYTSPSKSFEDSLDDYHDVTHTDWAHRWWLQCALGMDRMQAHTMACHVCTPIHIDEMYTVNTELFDTTGS